MEKIKLSKNNKYYDYVKNNYVYVAYKDCDSRECFRPHFFIEKHLYACITNYNSGCQNLKDKGY